MSEAASTILTNICFRYSQKEPSEAFFKKGVLSNFTKLTGKHLWHTRPASGLQLHQKRDSGTGVFL